MIKIKKLRQERLKRRNTLEIKYETILEKYVNLLEKDRSMLDENNKLKQELIGAKETIRQYKKKYGGLELESVKDVKHKG